MPERPAEMPAVTTVGRAVVGREAGLVVAAPEKADAVGSRRDGTREENAVALQIFLDQLFDRVVVEGSVAVAHQARVGAVEELDLALEECAFGVVGP